MTCARVAAAVLLAILAAPVAAQELSISLIERTADGARVAATASIPMASDETALAAAGTVRLWISDKANIAAAAILPLNADGRPLTEQAQ